MYQKKWLRWPSDWSSLFLQKKKEILLTVFYSAIQAIKTIAQSSNICLSLSLLLFAVDSYDEIHKGRGKKKLAIKLPIFLTPLLKKTFTSIRLSFFPRNGPFFDLAAKNNISQRWRERLQKQSVKRQIRPAFVLNKKALFTHSYRLDWSFIKSPPSSSESEYQHLRSLIIQKVGPSSNRGQKER